MSKNISILFIVLFALTEICFAQSNAFNGVWLLSEMHDGEETYPINMHVSFKTEGIIESSGEDIGTWTTNESDNTLTIKCDYLHFIEGTNTIKTLNDAELKIKNAKGDINRFDKISRSKDNQLKNDIVGEWLLENIETNGKTNVIGMPVNFNKNGIFYVQEKVLGTWDYKSDKALMFDTKKLKGEYNISKQNNDQLVIQGENSTLYFSKTGKENLKKVEKKINKIERLKFSEADFFDGNGNYKYEEDERKLPWKDYMEMMMTLVNVKQLVYKFSSLNEEADVFENKTLTANVNSNPQEQALSIDFIFYGYDRNNLPEDTALPPNEFDAYNKLYPEEDNNIFRVVGTEQISIIAGTFDCSVIEVVDGDDRSKKLWMINDKPGIYAKIIDEKRDENFGFYHVFELQDIK